MRYAIVINPASGKMNVDQKRMALVEPAAILGATIHGLDTLTADDFSQCARVLAARCDVLVVAGGDGTLSDVINAVDTAQMPIAFLPLGSGNAMKHALHYTGNLADIAKRIKQGVIHQFDLISCDNKKRAFIASVGLEGTITRLRDQYVTQGNSGFWTYLKACLNAYIREYRRACAKITIDAKVFTVKRLLSLTIAKQGFFGYGMNIVPKARFDDHLLHTLCLDAGLFKSLAGVVTSFTIGNRVGRYQTGRNVTIEPDRPLCMQFDGNPAWQAAAFNFEVLPKALKIKF